MTKRTRLIFLSMTLLLLIFVGRISTASFSFLLHDFWFNAGFLLLVLFSLVDQPFFSKDSNIFLNAITAGISLQLVEKINRTFVWYLFLSITMYLVMSSFVLMWLRNNKLEKENKFIQIISRINRLIGSPEVLFSTFFLWGILIQFTTTSKTFNALFVFWSFFIILRYPTIAKHLNKLFDHQKIDKDNLEIGIIESIISPRIAEATIDPFLQSNSIISSRVVIYSPCGRKAGEGVVIDERIVSGNRMAKIAITQKDDGWNAISQSVGKKPNIKLLLHESNNSNTQPVGVVETGTGIEALRFNIHPDFELQEGNVLSVLMPNGQHGYYQVIDGKIAAESFCENNMRQNVSVYASQLGYWNQESADFSTIPWVPPAGGLIQRVIPNQTPAIIVPSGRAIVGLIPNTPFPVHVCIQDIVTHNSAIIGVTGSGKSYLAFHLIENIILQGIKVLILDITRQHAVHLQGLNPTPIRQCSEIPAWWTSPSMLSIHQFATATSNIPTVTADFIENVFQCASNYQLQAGRNAPARVCIIIEEAHSLVPEWNQVAQSSDTNQVNRSSRYLLQGRKFGMGCLLITQRTANVTKTILNQCNTIFALQSFDQTGLDFLKNYMGEEYSHSISTLPNRYCVLVGKASSSKRPVIFRISDFESRWQDNNTTVNNSINLDVLQ